jgi:chitinase
MTSRTGGAPGRARRALVAALSVVVLAGLPAGAAAGDPEPVGGAAPSPLETAAPAPHPTVPPAPAADPTPAAPPSPVAPPAPAADPAPAAGASDVPDLRPYRVAPGDAPSQMYLDTVANEGRTFDFDPGGRVTVGFEPRPDDRWPVDGARPQPLTAGLESGVEMAEEATAPGPAVPPLAPDPSAPGPGAAPAAPGPEPIAAEGVSLVTPAERVALAPSAVGMRREVYGFLPYWQVADPDTRLDFGILTHVAYFSVGADARGNLRKRNSDGSLTTGWAGWTSSQMTSIINAAHRQKSRVTLTLTVFAWTPSQAATQKALLGSSAARLNLARQAVAAVRDRGADGINLDFEPLVAGSEDGFVALVRTMRAELDRVARGYHLSFDTLGRPGNYPLERALAAGGADAVFVMGYDYRTAGSTYAGSIDPLAGPAYDLAETVRAYLARIPASRLILGIPYYGRAWSTVSDAPNARTQTGTTYGSSTAVNYAAAVALAAEHGRRYDSREVSAWTAYRKDVCSSGGSCVTTWRQVYYDDAATLRARYDLVNRSGLRGTGIWALGYDGTRPELYRVLAEKFLNDTTPPLAGVVAFPSGSQPSEGFVVRWAAGDDWSGIAGYDVQVSVDGGPWTSWLVATTATSGTFLGTDNHGYAFRVSARDGKGNRSPWDVSSVYRPTPGLAKGGFVRITADLLNLRSAPSTSATRLGTTSSGEVFSITNGPVVADGYTWFELRGPLTTWGPVSDVVGNVWAAIAGAGAANGVAVQAPNATLLGAGIRSVAFGEGSAGSIGTSAAAAGARSFSPNGDGSRDALAIRWNNRRAFDELALRVFRPDGTLVGTRALAATAAGPQATAWDGTLDGAPLPDGSYVIQLVGTMAGVAYPWPAADPVAAGLPARVGVTIDRVAPTLAAAAASGTRLSPNGDGKYDAMKVSGRGSPDVVGWEVLVAPVVDGVAGAPIRRIAGTGRTVAAAWDGTADGGTRAPDGRYTVTLRMLDAAGNAAVRSWPALVDATPPALALAATPAAISPNGDGTADAARIAWTADEPLSGTLQIVRGTSVVRSWRVKGTRGAVTWDGRTVAGASVRDGRLKVVLAGVDALANRAAASRPLVLDRTVGSLRWSAAAFLPQDGDRLAATATISVRVVRPARLTLRILDASGATIRRAWTDRSFATGIASWRWDGRTGAGDWVPEGRYVAELTATSGLGTTVLRRSILAAAFSATPSTPTPAAGTTFRVTFRSVEPLAAAPTAIFRQAGSATVPMAVTRLANGSWTASVVVADGAPGPATVSLLGRDTAGGRNRTNLAVTIP